MKCMERGWQQMRSRITQAAKILRKGFLRHALAALLCLYILPQANAQTPPEILHTVHAIQVDSLGRGSGAAAIRARLIDRLKKSGNLEVVENVAAADVTLRGASNIWPTGVISLNPRSNSSTITNYQGYLSIEAVSKSGEVLWSYLVTPSRFHTASITDDLADQISSRLLEAIHTGIIGATSSTAAGAVTSIHLHAAGATLPAPLYLKWFQSSGVSVSYDAVGSEAGIQQLRDGKVDFAASDMPLQDDDSSAQLHLVQVPTVAGGVVPIYNLPGLHGNIRLTPEILAGIYSGTIRRWNDSHILEVNHGTHLPNADIVVVHRSEGSGTTFVWTSYLSLISSDWKNSVGAGTHVSWPTGNGATGSEGVAAMVQKTPNSIGYVELIYAIQHQLNYGAVRNPAGRFIKADLASITAAAVGSEKSAGPSHPLSILNASNKDAYPISTLTWLLIPTQGVEPQKKVAIAQLLSWMLTEGQKQCASLGYVPLPHELATQELQTISSLK